MTFSRRAGERARVAPGIGRLADNREEIQIRAAVLDDAEALVSLLNPIIEAETMALNTMLMVASLDSKEPYIDYDECKSGGQQ